MNVEVSYRLTGSTEDAEFLATLTELQRVLGGAVAVDEPDLEEVDQAEPEEGGAAAAPGGWTPKRADKFVSLLQSDARKALRFILQGAPEVEVADVIEHLGLSGGLALGGRMSSIGHVMRRMPKDLDWPIERQATTYYADEQVAAVLLDAFERYIAKHAA